MMRTVRAALAWAMAALADTGVDSPRVDAELILGHVLSRERAWLWANLEQAIAPEAGARFLELIARRAAREPLAYLLGEWEFYGRRFIVSPAVLVPRPETEMLVEAVLAWARAHDARQVADIGTGSGVIAVTLAMELPPLRVAAVDVSSAALGVARQNTERHGVGDRVRLLEGDLLAPVCRAGLCPLDAVAANLPYIAVEELPTLMPEVREYEPAVALHGGEEGLALITRLIAEALGPLRKGGLLAMEVGYRQAERVAGQMRNRGWQDVRVLLDYAGIPRHVLGECPA